VEALKVDNDRESGLELKQFEGLEEKLGVFSHMLAFKASFIIEDPLSNSRTLSSPFTHR
jgi:hypothetical protein